jgi:hypothetical protein
MWYSENYFVGGKFGLKIGEEVRRMTKLDCAIKLLWCLRFLDNCDGGDVEAFARAIMELGRSEEAKELTPNEKM